MIIFKKITLVFIKILLLSSLVAQQSTLFYHLSTEDGLKDISQNNFIFKDTKGYLWVSTLSSLERFDGVSFLSYPTNSNIPSGIKGKYIQGNFFEDEATNLWFTTFEAIIKYNRNKDQFSSFQLARSEMDTIRKDYHAFHLDKKKQELWVLADNEIYLFPINTALPYEKLPLKTKSKRFTFLEYSKGEKMLIGTPWLADTGVEIFSLKNGKWSNQYISLRNLEGPKVSQILVSQDKISWLLSDKGLIKFNCKIPNQSQLFKLEKGQNSSFRNGVFIDRDNIILSSDNGLYFFNVPTESFTNKISTKTHNQNGLKTNLSKELYLDNSKELWIANHGFGLGHMSLNGKKDFHFINPSLKPEKAPIVKIENREENIILATGNDGFFSLEKESDFNFKHQQHWLPNKPLFDLVVDSKKNIWASLVDLHLFQKDKEILIKQPENFKMILLLPLEEKILGTSTNGFNAVKEGGGAYIFKRNVDSDRQLYSRIFKKTSGEILASTYTNKLYLLENKGDSILKKLEIETGADILSFYEDIATGTIWCGTTEGLALLDSNNTFNYLLQNDWEIGRSYVYSVIEDEKKRLWIAAGNGFWTYDLKTKKLIRFRPENGLGNVVFMPNSQLKAFDGTLWFGTNEGTLFFHPDSISLPQSIPKVQISNLKINDIPYEGTKVIGELDELALNHNDNSLEFKVVCLDYQLPKYNQVRYRLKGYDKTWKVAENGAPIRYTKIPYGQTYQLEIIGVNAHQLGSPIKSLSLHIQLPYWQTWWFYLLLFLGMMAFSVGIAELYHRKKEMKRKVKEEKKVALIQQKKEISNDLHDDIGNDLSQIMSMSELAALKNNDGMAEALKSIEDLAAASIKNLRYTMWSLDVEDIKLSTLLFKIRAYVQIFFNRNQLEYHFVLPKSVPNIRVTGQVPRELFLITKECLSNIEKYAVAKEVTFTIHISNQQLNMEIKDDGIGFILSERRNQGKGLTTMKERAKRLEGKLFIKSRPNNGTSVTLNIPLKVFDN